ncbi:hypothetical protein FJT64_002669 [Amphibalanus amphitrite]|uniref:Uncharacterized protein n=1 Tax=Amphibalanus amphitrite TaxID=1232801 RepID=A0A6A4WF57_AMPAM|nr:hypothetical protein FJT64_002669 [Amphibalanus amphitrite]
MHYAVSESEARPRSLLARRAQLSFLRPQMHLAFLPPPSAVVGRSDFFLLAALGFLAPLSSTVLELSLICSTSPVLETLPTCCTFEEELDSMTLELTFCDSLICEDCCSWEDMEDLLLAAAEKT